MRIAKTATLHHAEINVNGRNILVTTGFNSHRNGFVHYCIINTGDETAESKACYINRTWEAYPYQTVKRAAARKLTDSKLRNELLARF